MVLEVMVFHVLTYKRLPTRSHIQVGSLEVGSFHAAPRRAPRSPIDLMGVVWETAQLQTTLLRKPGAPHPGPYGWLSKLLSLFGSLL